MTNFLLPFLSSSKVAPNLKIKLSKPSLAAVEDNVLKALFQYKQIKAIYENAFKDN